MEVLISLTILAVVLLPVMIGFSQAIITTNQTSIESVASSIARATLENLKVVGYDNILSQERAAAPGNARFEVAVQVSEPEPNGPQLEGLKVAVVSVYQKGSASPMVVLTTYFTPVGV